MNILCQSLPAPCIFKMLMIVQHAFIIRKLSSAGCVALELTNLWAKENEADRRANSLRSGRL